MVKNHQHKSWPPNSCYCWRVCHCCCGLCCSCLSGWLGLSIFETANKLWEWKQATHTHSRAFRIFISMLLCTIYRLLKYFVIFLNHHKFELVLPRHLAVGHQCDKNFPNDGNINKLEMLNSTILRWAAGSVAHAMGTGAGAGAAAGAAAAAGPQNLLSACCGTRICASPWLASCHNSRHLMAAFWPTEGIEDTIAQALSYVVEVRPMARPQRLS